MPDRVEGQSVDHARPASTQGEQAQRPAASEQDDGEASSPKAQLAPIDPCAGPSAAWHRRLVESQPDLICGFLPDTTLTFVNAAYARFFDRHPKELIGRRFIGFLSVEGQAMVGDHLAALTPDSPERQCERESRRADGELRWLLWHDFALFDASGTATEFQSIGVDITERRRAEDALRQATEELAAVIQVLPDLYFRMGQDGTFLDCLAGPSADLYVAPSELVGNRIERVLPPPVGGDLLGIIQQAIATRSPASLEYPLTMPSGVKIFEARVVPFQESQAVAVVRDITERRRMEQALCDSEYFLRKSQEVARLGSYRFDPRVGKWVSSPLLDQIFGIDDLYAKDVDGWLDIVHPEQRAEMREYLWRQVLGARRPFAREYRILRVCDREVRWVFGRGELELDESGTVTAMIGTIQDITERKEADERLFEEKERAQVTLHSIGDGVIATDASARVDFMNPVAESLTGWSTVAARGRPLDEVLRLLDEHRREPIPDPVASCLRDGPIRVLARHGVLIGRDGAVCAVDASAAPIRGRKGSVLGAVLVIRDVSENRRLARQLAHDATHDALTGLVNRAEFERRLHATLAATKTHGTRHALCYMDLDQFKVVNDTAGHAAGDELLKQICVLLSGMIGDGDTLARIGGDEMGLLLVDTPLERAQTVAQSMVNSIRDHRFDWGGRSYRVGVSVGLVPIVPGAESAAQILTQADVACYIAKQNGRNRVHLYRLEDGQTAVHHNEILDAAGVRNALEQGRFRLYYQPMVSLGSPEPLPVRYEVLLRILPEDGLGEPTLPPSFITAAERFGLMDEIDRWVIETAFRDYGSGIGRTGAKIAINLSGSSLSDETLLAFIETQLARFAVPPGQVCFEITETAGIQNLHRAIDLMTALKGHGCQLALDDFGSGLSSFRYLKSLPVDYVKIDGSFVRNMAENESDCVLVEAINRMSHTLGIETVAEYVHSAAVVECLTMLRVDYAQGFFFGRPAPWTGDP